MRGPRLQPHRNPLFRPDRALLIALAWAACVSCAACAQPSDAGREERAETADVGRPIQPTRGAVAPDVAHRDADVARGGLSALSAARASTSTSGCAASGAPVRGAVEDALGILAIVVLALRLRRATRGRSAGTQRAAARTAAADGDRVPYVNLSFRESLASFSDER